jgi:hypothetical protein
MDMVKKRRTKIISHGSVRNVKLLAKKYEVENYICTHHACEMNRRARIQATWGDEEAKKMKVKGMN